jgi:hypothetical protein
MRMNAPQRRQPPGDAQSARAAWTRNFVREDLWSIGFALLRSEGRKPALSLRTRDPDGGLRAAIIVTDLDELRALAEAVARTIAASEPTR